MSKSLDEYKYIQRSLGWIKQIRICFSVFEKKMACFLTWKQTNVLDGFFC